MRILGVYMKNIRSYPEAVVVFPPEGITVIYGPTGSGKTSILMSISHALFGFPRGQKRGLFDAYGQPFGIDLLRAGTQEGRVRVLIYVRGKLYVVERRFRRVGNEHKFSEGLIEEYVVDSDTGQIKLNWKSPVYTNRDELDNKISEIIGIREKTSPRGSLRATVFTSALYVPQFNIHEILEYEPEQRREVIEKALGLEKYKIIKTNINNLSNLLKDKVKMLEGTIQHITFQLGRANKDQLRRKLEEFKNEIKNLELKQEELKNTRLNLEKTAEELKRNLDVLVEEKHRLELLTRQYEDIQVQLKDREIRAQQEVSAIVSMFNVSLTREQVSIRTQLSDLLKTLEEKKKSVLDERTKLESKLSQIEGKLKNILVEEKKVVELYGKLSGELHAKIQKLEELRKEHENKKKLLESGVCPLCLQPITHAHGYKLIADIEKKIGDLEKEINDLKLNLEELNNTKTRLSSDIESVTKDHGNLKLQLDEANRLISELDKALYNLNLYLDDITKLEEKARTINIEEVKAKLEEVNSEIERTKNGFKEIREKIEKLEKQIEELTKQWANLTAEVRTIENQLRDIEKLEKDLAERVARRDRLKKLQDMLSQLENVVEYVEKEVVKILAKEFRELFSKYVRILLHDQPLEAIITDDFGLTFKVLVGNRPYDIGSLSGGQSIALSLAYRLALNATVRAYSPHLKRSVLILDEPTTGFSKDLVARLRELLRELGLAGLGQVIVVTHDDTLMEIGDCKIRLEIDSSKLETKVYYEECSVRGKNFEDYKYIVEEILRGKLKEITRLQSSQV